jgi:hypothetical protein
MQFHRNINFWPAQLATGERAGIEVYEYLFPNLCLQLQLLKMHPTYSFNGINFFLRSLSASEPGAFEIRLPVEFYIPCGTSIDVSLRWRRVVSDLLLGTRTENKGLFASTHVCSHPGPSAESWSESDQ